MAEPLVAPELVTPPLGLVALLGRPELHPALREHLRSQLRPPLESVGVGDLAEATSVLTRRKRNGPSAAAPPAPANPLIPPVVPVGLGPAQTPALGATDGSGSSNPSDGTDAPRRGMLRADWTRKHRERRPAVALAFLPHEEVEGDPNAWVSLTRRIDALRDAATGAGCALALVVVGDDAPERLPEDRVAALTRQAKIDRSALVSMPQPPTPDAMRAVGALCANLAKAYYVGECARHAAKTLPGGGIEAAEPGFKAGIFCEFHGDWGGAWRMYKTAYDGLVAAHVASEAAGGPGGGTRDVDAAGGVETKTFGPVQARFERMAVAERLHYKLCALHLTLNPGDPGMCVAQMRAHHDAFKRPPAWLPPAALPRHWSWVARQHRAFAELLSQRTPWGGSASAAAGAAAGTMPLPSPPPPNAPMTYLPGFWYHAAANATERLRRAAESVDDVDEGNSVGDGSDVVDGKYVGTFARGDGPITDAEYLGHVNARLPSAPELVKTSIELLTKAHDHFKRTAPKDGSAGSARLFASIVARLARGYLLAGDFASSKRLFDSVAPVYRREGWDDLLGGVLMGMKDCARHAKSNSEYLEICLEIAALGGTSASDAVAAMAAAQAAMEDADGTEVTIGMGTTPRSGHAGPGGDDHPLARAVHCVAGFGASHAVPGESIELTVAVRSCLPATLPVKSVAAVFGDGMYDWTSEDAVSELPARTWRVFVVKVTPAWGHPVNVVALVLTLANGVRFRLELGDGNGESPGRRGWLAPDERLPAAFNSGCNLGVHSLDLRAAPLKMSLSVNVDGPVLLGEVTALPLEVVSTGDGLDDATLVLTVKEGDKAYLGSTRENGGIRSEEASAPGPDVVLLREPDSQSAIQPREPIAIGNVPPGGAWRGKVYVLWRRLGPPVTLATELRGVRSGLPAESGGEANAALETVAELSAIAPFTATHRGLSAYRTFALVLDEPASAGTVEHATDGDVTASTVSVAAAGSILAVDSVGFAAVGFKGDEGAMARNEPNGGVELGEGDEFLQLWPRRAGGDAEDALNVTWRRRGGLRPVRSVLPASRSRVPAGKVPLTVTLECPPRLHAGASFQMEVRCRNDTSTPQALTVRVVDCAGFVYVGARSADVTVDPDGGQTRVPFTLTAVNSGEMLLPDLEITAKGFGAQLRLPRESRELYVLPGERQQAATAVV